MDRGACWAAAHGVVKRQAWLNDWHTKFWGNWLWEFLCSRPVNEQFLPQKMQKWNFRPCFMWSFIRSFSGSVAFRRHIWEKSRSQDTGLWAGRTTQHTALSTTTLNYSCLWICSSSSLIFKHLRVTYFFKLVFVSQRSACSRHSYKKCWIPDLT